jgi:hypothetical protein
MFLIIVFASENDKLLEFEEKIASVIKKRGLQIDSMNAETEQIGVLTHTVVTGGRVSRIPLQRHRWKLPLLKPVDESTLRRLRKDLTDYEVQEISTAS